MRFTNRSWLAAAMVGLVATPAFAQTASPPTSLPTTPIQQAQAWQQPALEPTPALGPATANGPLPNPAVTSQQAAESAAAQEAFVTSAVTAALVQAQLQQAESASAASTDQAVLPTSSAEPTEPAAPSSSAAASPSAAPAAVTLTPVTAVDARGAAEGATLRWTLPDDGHAVRYLLYCDDGTLSTSSQHVALASDECPSEIALTADTKPDSSWTVCGTLEGTATSADLHGLANGQPYAFALAAQDETGSVGVLSTVSCAIPSANGEYELDQPTANTTPSETGEGCSTGGTSFASPFVLGALALVGLRRRRS